MGSPEIADTVLRVAEHRMNRNDAVQSLKNLMSVEGLSQEALQQIKTAISIVNRDWKSVIDREI